MVEHGHLNPWIAGDVGNSAANAHQNPLRLVVIDRVGAVSEFGKNRTLSEKVATRAAILIMAFGLS